MVFSSLIFIFLFLPIVLGVHSLLYGLSRRYHAAAAWLNLFLFLASLIFYAWGEPRYIILLLACTLMTYGIGITIEKYSSRRYLYLGIAVNLCTLGYFKYAMLFADTANAVFPELDISLKIALPLGISFYVFQAISYLIDVHRHAVPASRNFINFGCYLTMFPQLVAGPIVRYSQVMNELATRTLSLASFSDGISRFIIGLAKKVLIADTLGRVADAAFAVQDGSLCGTGAWIGLVCYTLQIYYDFSGYSDMAIGIGKMLGFSFPENFNYPYISKSIQEFWRRWHLSLSTWFKDYLYIPLGGSRRGVWITYRNLFIVFTLCGFWHGASWTYIAWGAYYGCFLTLERAYPEIIRKLPSPLQHCYVMLTVMLGWVLFKAESFPKATAYYKSLLGIYPETIEMNRVWLYWYGHDVSIALFCALIFSCPIIPALQKWILYKNSPTYNIIYWACSQTALIMLLFTTLMPIFGSSYNAFIYFRF